MHPINTGEMTMKKRLLFIISFVLTLVLFSCSEQNPEEKAWNEAQKIQKLKGYKEYVSNYPEGKHKAEAMDIINSTYKKFLSDTSKLLAGYDDYVKVFPGGQLIPYFEESIFNYARAKGDSMLHVIYDSRFPQGKYITEEDTSPEGGGEADDYAKLTEGKISFVKFFENNPDSPRKDELEQLLADSIQANPSVNLYEQYIQLFPSGKYLSTLGNMAEDIYYQEVLKTKSNTYLQKFLSNFPDSKWVNTVTITANAEGANVQVLDSLGNEIASVISPGEVKLVKGMKIQLKATKEDYEPLTETVEITDPNQNINLTLKRSVKFVFYENFDNEKSVWAKTSDDYSAVVKDGHLVLSTSQQQVEILRKVNIDFKRDFTLKMKFKFVKDLGREKNYVGLLWGISSKLNYFFVTMDGKSGYGSKERRSISAENPFGYDGWKRSWVVAQSYKKNAYNELVISKVGKTVTYTLNGLKISVFRLMNTPRDRTVGIGAGEAEVRIDELVLKQ